MSNSIVSAFAALDSESENPAFESLESQGVQEPEIEIGPKGLTLTFERVNEVTWKLTDGRGSIAWSGDRGGNYRTTRAVAWLIGIGSGQWVVRYRNRASRPMKLPKARAYALELFKGIRSGKVVDDPIRRLDQLCLDALEPMPGMAEILAIEIADYPPPYSRPTEDLPAQKSPETHPLDYHPDGYPKLPDCLRRKA